MGLAAVLLGLAILVLGIAGANAFVKANPGRMAGQMVTGAAVLALALGGVLVFLGRGIIGFPLVGLGLSLIAREKGRRRTVRQPGGRSRVRSAGLEMELDLDTGVLCGRVLGGAQAGRPLDDLNEAELMALWSGFRTDPESRALLEAYLDRRTPGWRQHREADGEAGGLGAPGNGPMSPKEAEQILGLEPDAGPEEVRRAHRTLMKKLHPDQGGSTYLASRVNEAKEVLLRRHR
jgi:hypothetical protein